jgi:hypothetical protein
VSHGESEQATAGPKAEHKEPPATIVHSPAAE